MADWPDAYRVNRFVRGESDDESPEEALADFRRFPAWMWRNTDVVDFLGWLRKWNSELSPRKSIPRPRSARGLATPASTTSAPGVAGAEPCEQEVVEQLVDLQRLAAEQAGRDRFYAEQNARLVVNAERYYRSVFRGSVGSWNLRDGHMAETLEALTAHLEETAASWEELFHEELNGSDFVIDTGGLPAMRPIV